MVISEDLRQIALDREKYRDSKPLKHYRPPLKSDPRNILQKFTDLSLETRPEDGTSNWISEACLEKSNSYSEWLKPSLSEKSQPISVHHRLDIQKIESTGSALPVRCFRALNGRGVSVPIGTQSKVNPIVLEKPCPVQQPLKGREHSNIINPKNSCNSSLVNSRVGLCGRSTGDSKLVCSQKASQESLNIRFSLESQSSSEELKQNSSASNLEIFKTCEKKDKACSVQSSRTYSRRRLYSKLSIQNGRANQSNSESDSGVEQSPSKCFSDSSSFRVSRNLAQSNGQRYLFSENGTSVQENPPLSNYDFNDFQLCGLNSGSDLSISQLCSSVEDENEVVCITPDLEPPRPIPLLPVPDHLRRYSPLTDMERSTSPASYISDSSSGVSSTDQRIEDLPSSCSYRSVSACSMTALQKEPCRSSSSPFSEENEYTKIKAGEGQKRSSRWDGISADLSAKGLPTSFGTPNVLKRKYQETKRNDADLDEVVSTCFSKQFEFQFRDSWKLPDISVLFKSQPWQLENFLKLKNQLNAVKDGLNDLSLQDWHAHTRRRNKAGNILWKLRSKVDPELATQAWCKFYENVSVFPLVPKSAISQGKLNSVHLCEAPGAFIASLNHYLLTNFGTDFKFDWRAVSLNPYYEGNPLSCMINDDRFILQTLDRWLFGQDKTGDLSSSGNLQAILTEASAMGDILLVTADGSIDCQDDPAEQEEHVAWLHFCETVAALKLLAPGGSFLIKMFTFYEHSSICLMYFLNCVFGSVTVNKPVTSKEGNSEVYVICCDYIGATKIKPWLDALLLRYGKCAPVEALFPLDAIPSSFLKQLHSCADFYRQLQTKVIQENIRSFHNPTRKDAYLTAAIRHDVGGRFFDRYKIQKLDRAYYLSDKKQLLKCATPNIDPRDQEGSYNDRRKRLALTPAEQLQYLKDDLHYLNVEWPVDSDVIWMEFPGNPKGFQIIRGKPITKVHSSKFCLGSLLKLRNKVRELAKDFYVRQNSHESSQSMTLKINWPDDFKDAKNIKVFTLDFQNKLWASLEDGRNATNEKDACREILSAIEHKVFRDDCLELRGYPLLTQFNVGLVYLLGHLFEQVGFVRPQGQDIRILFYKYRKFHPEMKHHWDEVVSIMNHDSKEVLSVVKISELSDGDFYKYVTQINNLCVAEQIQDLLQNMPTNN